MKPFKAKKSLGQNFLINPKIAERIVAAAELKVGDVVLEIGPGMGMLTRALLLAGARVIALEADVRAVEILNEAFKGDIDQGALTLIHGDVRETDVANILPNKTPYSVIANIPYYLSGMLFEKFLSGSKQPKTLVFLVQKEVAERIARSKKESLLSLSVKVYGSPAYIGTVTRGNFRPQPNVDSAILAIRGISRAKLEGIDEAFFFKVIKAGFASRRKQLAGNLAPLAAPERVREVFQKLNIASTVRGEDLNVEMWLKISALLCP